MKTLRLLVMICALASVGRAYDVRVCHVVEQLRTMSEVGGEAVGYAGTPHDFYLLYRYCWQAATNQDLQDMLTDESPVVRIMGAKCILTAPFRKIEAKRVDRLLADPQKLPVGPSGCAFVPMTVGEVVAQLKKDDTFLGK